MRAVIVLLLLGHAAMHLGALSCGLLFASATPGLVSDVGLDPGLVQTVEVLLTAVAAGGFTLAALALASAIVPPSWLRPLIVSASAASAVMLAGLFSSAVMPGLAIDAVLVAAVVRRSLEPAPSLEHERGSAAMNVAPAPQ